MDRFTGDAAHRDAGDTDAMTAGMWRRTEAELLNAIADDAQTMLRSEMSSLCAIAELVARDSTAGCPANVANHLCSTSTLTLAKARRAVRLATRLYARPAVFAAVHGAEITKAAAIMIMDFIDDPPEAMSADELARAEDVLIDCARAQGRTRLSSIIAGIREHYREPPGQGAGSSDRERKDDQSTTPPGPAGSATGSGPGTPGLAYGRCRTASRGSDDSARNSLYASRTLGGRYALRGDLDSETGERLVAALSPFSAPRPEHDGTRDRRSAAKRRADGLAEFLRRHTECDGHTDGGRADSGPADSGPAYSDTRSASAPASGDTRDTGARGRGAFGRNDATRPAGDSIGSARGTPGTPFGAQPGAPTAPGTSAHSERPTPTASHDLGGGTGTGTALSLHIGLRDLADTDDDIAARSTLISQGRFEEVFDNLPHGMTDWFANVSVGAARRLACDAAVTPVGIDSAGAPLNLGRTRRLAGRSQRRALAARDHGCAFPRCDRPPAWCIAHHIWHWVDGGPTNLDNLVSLCSEHHRAVHHHGWTVAIDGHRRLPRFLAPAADGTSMQWLDSDGAPADAPTRARGNRCRRGRSPDGGAGGPLICSG